uniref:hypothetical protein n=1 Tax=Variovorax paradoxus TaxID=34073 RepID=UPI001ABD2810
MKKLLVSLALGLSVLAAGTTGFAQTPAPAAFEAYFDIDRPEPAVVFRQHDNRALARLDDGL